MLRNFSVKTNKILLAIALPVWVLMGFYSSNLILASLVGLLGSFGFMIQSVNRSMLETVFAACVYVLALLITVGTPWLIRRRPTTLKALGLDRLPSWKELGLAPLAFIFYLIVSGVLVFLAGELLPWFDVTQTQEVGFTDLTQRYEYFLAFLTLVVIAPLAEEMLFRGYLYGKLRNSIPVWLAMIITSLLFALVHAQWNVGLDVFVLSIVACLLREITGSLWPAILLHIIKNALAFYILFINTSFLVK